MKFLFRSTACILALAMLSVPRAAHTQSTQSAPAAALPPVISESTPLVQAEVIGLRSARGDVVCSLFNDAAAFPRDDKKIFRTVKAPIIRDHALCRFPGIPAGDYAMVVFHDENGDGEFNQNAFGMPEEGYGFSRDAAALFSAPSFDSAKFHYDGTRLYMIINIRY